MKTIWNEDRTWGVEIEFFGASRDKVVRALTLKGIKVVKENYNHETRSYWKIVTDVSVNTSGCENSNSAGNEIVSPILEGQDGLDQLKIVCETLEEVGAKVDKTCGVHIHHGIDDYDLENLKKVYALYIRYENEIDSMMPKSRRNNNQYCMNLSGSYFKDRDLEERKGSLERLKNCKTFEQVEIMFNSRYYKLNLKGFRTRGTIEFRQHSGTIEFEKISNWIFLTQAMIERAKENVAFGIIQSSLNTFRETFEVTKASNENLFNAFKFYQKRIKELNKEVA